MYVASPKETLSGSRVADTVASGDLGAVAAYCERDVAATLGCYNIACQLLPNLG